MKASDISDQAMLEVVRRCNDAECNYPNEDGAGWHGGRPGWGYDPGNEKGHWTYWTCISAVDFPEFPDKIVRAKLKRLIDRGLLDGCSCGCRGDFTITEKGRELLGQATGETLTTYSPPQ